MALPTTGQISMGDINVELGRARTTSISLEQAENGIITTINNNSPSKPSNVNPATLSEWRGYNHTYVSNYVLYVQVPSGGLEREIIFLSGSTQVGSLVRGANSQNVTLSIVVGQPLSIRADYSGGGSATSYPIRTLTGGLLGTLSWKGSNVSNTLSIGNAGTLTGAYLRINA